MEPIVTWIIPVYNGEKYISESISSILSQPCKDNRIIVVDDGSIDDTRDIVTSIQDERILYVYQKNSGVSVARNVGIEKSETEYIAFLDADDVLCKNVYDEDLHSILQTREYDLISFSFLFADEKLEKGRPYWDVDKPEQFINTPSKIDVFKLTMSFIYKKSLLMNEPATKFPEGIRVQEDAIFTLQVLQKSQKMYTQYKYSFAYRNNPDSVLHTQDFHLLLTDAVRGWHECKDICTQQWAKDECDIRLFKNYTDYIRKSCENGIPVKEIAKSLEPYQIDDVIKNWDKLWISCKKNYQLFQKYPNIFWIKHRIRHLKQVLKHVLLKSKLIRDLLYRQRSFIEILRFIE